MLQADDGRAWSLDMSAGMERFIGRYPRVVGFQPLGTVLLYYR